MPEKANSQLIRTINEKRLLNLIREKGPISRNGLANLTKISKVSVSSIINRLDKDGFILEIGKGESTSKGGKRPTLLKLNPDNGYVIGLQIKRSIITIVLANIESEIKGITQLSYEIDASIDEVISNIFIKIDYLFHKNNIPLEKLVSIGIGVPGIIDYIKGELKYAVTLREWVNLPLASRFSAQYNVPTIIENDVKAITLVESLYGSGRCYSNIACVMIESGIGCGIFLNGQLVRGETGNSGEIGYFEIHNCTNNNDTLDEMYGNHMHIGELFSEVNLSNTLKKKMQTNQSVSEKDLEHFDLKDLLMFGEKGNKGVQEILNELAYPLAIVCMNLIKTLNPGQIIMCGSVINNSSYLFNKIEEIVQKKMKRVPFESCKIVVGELKDKAGLIGSITLALQTIFEQPVKHT